MVNHAITEKQVCHSVQLVVVETASVDLVVREDHFSFVAFVIQPGAFESRPIAMPGHFTYPAAFAVALASLEEPHVLGLLLLAVHTRHAIVVPQYAVTVWSPILKHPSELVTILVVYLAQANHK